MQRNDSDKQLLTPKEVAHLLGLHPDSVRRAIRSGELEAVRIGPRGRYRVSRSAIAAYLKPIQGETDAD
jgi:excisionase family DNA binding protein